MKTTYKLILAAFAAAVALSSCTKDIAADKQDKESADGLRTIEISFETPTKTALDEESMCPVFKMGDKIIVSNGDEWEECTVTPSFLGNGGGSFTTKLSGRLSAVYPPKAAIINNGKMFDDVKVPATQTGKFEDAGIFFGHSNSNSITLYSRAAVLRFYVGQSIGVDSLVISIPESSNYYLADGEFDETGRQLSDKRTKKIKVVPQGDEDVCYVAAHDISNDTLTVRSYTRTQKAENEDGLVTRRYYPVNFGSRDLLNVFIPYYIEVPVGGDKIQRWGYCNVGAFRPEEPGKYFAWGSTTGLERSKDDDYYLEENPHLDWQNCPFNNGTPTIDTTFSGLVESDVCPDGTLVPEYDAAVNVWRGYWRMPNKDEIDSLYAHITPDGIGKKGLTIEAPYGTLFFPHTGCGSYTEGDPDTPAGNRLNWTDSGMYWTSSLYETDKAKAYCFNFAYYEPEDSTPSQFKFLSGTGEERKVFDRMVGMPIRPIFDLQEPQEVSLEIITAYDDGGTI